MAFSLHDATVANYLQICSAPSAASVRRASHTFTRRASISAEVVETRLAPDMLPLRFQIVSVAHHSRGAIEAARNGVFSPSSGKPDLRLCRASGSGD